MRWDPADRSVWVPGTNPKEGVRMLKKVMDGGLSWTTSWADPSRYLALSPLYLELLAALLGHYPWIVVVVLLCFNRLHFQWDPPKNHILCHLGLWPKSVADSYPSNPPLSFFDSAEACINRNLAIFGFIFTKEQARLVELSAEYLTFLVAANQIDSVNLLLRRYPDFLTLTDFMLPNLEEDYENPPHWSHIGGWYPPLFYKACLFGRAAISRMVLQRCVELGVTDHLQKNFARALEAATLTGCCEVVELVLEAPVQHHGDELRVIFLRALRFIDRCAPVVDLFLDRQLVVDVEHWELPSAKAREYLSTYILQKSIMSLANETLVACRNL